MFVMGIIVTSININKFGCVGWHHYCRESIWHEIFCAQMEMYNELNQCKYIVNTSCGNLVVIGVHYTFMIIQVMASHVPHHAIKPLMVYDI